MPPLKKSYSDQSRSATKRHQWQRSKSNPNATTPAAPLLPVSESTKNKLNAFQFEEPKPKADDDSPRLVGPSTSTDKENQAAGPQSKDNRQSAANTDKAKTPVSRATWQDLLGVQQPTKEDDDVSPNDRVEWSNDPIPIDITASPILSRKSRKRRARSSSPASSPGPSTIKKLRRADKTPHADPASELWDRFSLAGISGAAASPPSAMNPLLARMMASSSPRPPSGDKTPGSERSLRKSVSCGSNWPKRRRMERLDLDQASESQGVEKTASKSALVSALLETVDEIRKSKPTTDEEEQVSSPSRRRSPRKSRTEAPISQRRPTPETASERRPALTPSGPGNAANYVDLTQEVSPVKSSSDYFDDAFDDDTLMELDATIVKGAHSDDTTLIAAQPAPAVSAPPDPKAIEDEFGDFDDDLFDGAEDLMVGIESKHASQAPVGGQRHDRPQLAHAKVDEDEYGGDDFGDDLDLEAIELAATQCAKGPPALPTGLKPRAIQRYLITKVLDSSYPADDYSREFPEKLLLVQDDKNDALRTVHLRGDWYDTEAHPKAYVHVIGEFDSAGRCIVDDNQNMIILHPDQLISATVLADSFMCIRRAVLQDRVKATGEASSAMIYGTILHEVFQEALMANNWEPQFLGKVVAKILDKHLEDLYIIKVSMDDARTHVLSKTPEMRAWAQRFVSPRPRLDAVVQGRNGEKVNMCLSKLLDVEEHVWSPMYGLKGNIDATVQVTMNDKDGSKTLTVPFEVKTGRNANQSHQAQTLLYNLLLSDRYDVEILYGILYYMETSQTLRIPAVRLELRHMIMQRNRLACYIRERSVQLPPMKRDKFACGKCYAQTACFIYHRLADDGTGESSGVNDKFEDLVKHLTPTHRDFFLKWEDLLTKEEKESQRHRRELWTMVSTEREKLGRCLSNVVIEEGTANEDKTSTKINRFMYTFIKDRPASGFSFLDSQLAVGEPIVVSDEQGHFALGIGFVTAIAKHRITVAVDRRLHNVRIRQPGFDEVNNQVFASIMEVAPEGGKPKQTQDQVEQPPVHYRIDKDEFSNGMATVRNNLIQVMADGPSGSREIRRLIVDLAPPRFKSVPTQYTISDKDGLNTDQKAAIQKVMSAIDYALVLGMPGTGKTTTIAHIIRALVAQGKTVLLTSYTHSAVDNILLKLKNDKTPVLRLGAAAKVHPEVRDFAILASQPLSSFDEIREAWHGTPVVATTCLGINHALFNERTFDYCIVDEASQITLPVCLGPIRMARTFVLVGDHNQLPPLVQNEEARLGGLDVSLFKLLSDTHPESVVNLEHQYRMCEDIMTLSNTLIYKGRLKCGTEALRRAALEIPNMDGLRQRHFDAATFIAASQRGSPIKGGYCISPQKNRKPPTASSVCSGPRPGSCWLRDLLDPEARVRFVNTDQLGDSQEQAKGNRIVNLCEARVVAQLVDALVSVGVPPSEIGIMTHYRSQLSQLRHLLRNHPGGQQIEMHTADRFQGRDKEVVVLSLVRSNENCSIGELLKDWRRINVAFTRAKTKLLVVGSRSTLGGCGEEEMLARFVGMMEERAWVYDLKEGMLEAHYFPESEVGTQASTVLGTSPRKGSPMKLGTTPRKSQVKTERETPRKSQVIKTEKTQIKLVPKKARIGQRALMTGKPVLRDILNDMMGGKY
ncbi:hypothetical protein QBC47DRAFT_372637 [Echria macrotheca]|uniref:DNA replication ATP-dependent helicase/nuclease n=1 Tax=Echria macrotheca TaxID=438768 RepID=A0AAJ0BPG4_9PEZI|nr:hypothetical protein QBC47DRAFT_372637 [Echria macrotheca]